VSVDGVEQDRGIASCGHVVNAQHVRISACGGETRDGQ
jgi:hypothetical protein